MSRRIVTHDIFLERMAHFHPHINVLGTYQAAKEPIECQCLICGTTWFARPLNLTFSKNPTGCPSCGGSRHKSHGDFVHEMKELHPEIEVIGSYVNSHTPVALRCLIHNHDFSGIPTNLRRRATSGCRLCSRDKLESKIASQLKEYCEAHYEGVISEYCVVKNPATQKWLPFDIYIPNLNGTPVFCEIMGQQHYGFIPYLHQDIKNYHKQIVRDDYKEQYARKYGRYVEIDLRRIHTLEEAVTELLMDRRGWLCRSVEKCDAMLPLNSLRLEELYSK